MSSSSTAAGIAPAGTAPRARARRRQRWFLGGALASALLGLLALAPAASAGADDLSCTIPFSFTVGSKTLPPGTYSITSEPGQGLVFLRDFNHGVFSLASPLEDRQVADPKLVFHRYGSQYLLREVWMGGGLGRELPEPRQERELSAAAARGGEAADQLEQVVLPTF